MTFTGVEAQSASDATISQVWAAVRRLAVKRNQGGVISTEAPYLDIVNEVNAEAGRDLKPSEVSVALSVLVVQNKIEFDEQVVPGDLCTLKMVAPETMESSRP